MKKEGFLKGDLVFQEGKMTRTIKKPTFSNFIVFSKNCGLLLKRKGTCMLDSLVANGNIVLQMSKLLLMRQTHVTYLPRFKDICETSCCQYNDTGEPCCNVKCANAT